MSEVEPRAWVGCLGCYNDGRLRGVWVDGSEAEDVDLADVGCTFAGHEELWVFDHAGYLDTLRGECSPMEAARAADALTEWAGHADDSGVPVEALLEFHRNHWHDAPLWQGDPDESLECYVGSFDDVEDFVYDWMENYFDMSTFPSEIVIDVRGTWDASLRHDYLDLENPEGGVWIFRSW